MADSDQQRATEGELSVEKTTDVFNVSCAYLLQLLETDALPSRSAGNQRHIYREDLAEYKARNDEEHRKALEAQALNMGY